MFFRGGTRAAVHHIFAGADWEYDADSDIEPAAGDSVFF
jgi:hypothetical protein